MIRRAILTGAVLAALCTTVSAQGWAPPASLPGDVVIGDPDAPVTVVEYASLTCPHCRDFHERVLPELREGWVDTGKARLAFRHFPLDGPGVAAALAVHCLPVSGRAEAVDRLYADGDWSGADDPASAILVALTGLEGEGGREALMACMASADEGEAMVGPALEARRNGVAGTPTFFVGSVMREGTPTAAELGHMVDEALAAEFTR